MHIEESQQNSQIKAAALLHVFTELSLKTTDTRRSTKRLFNDNHTMTTVYLKTYTCSIVVKLEEMYTKQILST